MVVVLLSVALTEAIGGSLTGRQIRRPVETQIWIEAAPRWRDSYEFMGDSPFTTVAICCEERCAGAVKVVAMPIAPEWRFMAVEEAYTVAGTNCTSSQRCYGASFPGGAVGDSEGTLLVLNFLRQRAFVFFATTIIMFFVGYGLELFRIVPLIIYHLRRRYLCQTEDDLKKKTWAPGDLGYGKRIPEDMVVITIVLCYSVIAPVIIPFGVIYFGLGWLVLRNQAPRQELIDTQT
ncbi:hypothetical protein RJ640_028959 [Escallonia rubra]|uniref:CSC1/OSCA1-like 7TM region domain-containing protein n=1 Tax=Escallonia rubra TaxID=112253 RepID=A0AA88RN80_9ASTE|nr:hypothetical protein RJ640_028959 [Escallonia rubra]